MNWPISSILYIFYLKFAGLSYDWWTSNYVDTYYNSHHHYNIHKQSIVYKCNLFKWYDSLWAFSCSIIVWFSFHLIILFQKLEFIACSRNRNTKRGTHNNHDSGNCIWRIVCLDCDVNLCVPIHTKKKFAIKDWRYQKYRTKF